MQKRRTSAGSKESTFGRYAQVTDKLPIHVLSVIMAALHKTADQVATEGVCQVLVLRSVAV
jgi:hypothetical protein